MGIEQIQQALLKQHGLRVSDAMGEYILAKLKSAPGADLPIIAGDAKTGVAIRATIPAAELQRFSAATPISPRP